MSSLSLSSILSPRAVTLLVFILVVLFLGATFNVHVGPESFGNIDLSKIMGGGAEPKEDVKEGATVPQKTKEGLDGVVPHEPTAMNAGAATTKPKTN